MSGGKRPPSTREMKRIHSSGTLAQRGSCGEMTRNQKQQAEKSEQVGQESPTVSQARATTASEARVGFLS